MVNIGCLWEQQTMQWSHVGNGQGTIHELEQPRPEKYTDRNGTILPVRVKVPIEPV